jgi:hypothetical protein
MKKGPVREPLQAMPPRREEWRCGDLVQKL